MKLEIVTTLDATDMTLLELAPIVDRIKQAVDPNGPRRYIKMRIGKTEGLGAIKQVAYGAVIGGTPAPLESHASVISDQRMAREEILRTLADLDKLTTKAFSSALGGDLKIDEATNLVEAHRQVCDLVRGYLREEEGIDQRDDLRNHAAFR